MDVSLRAIKYGLGMYFFFIILTLISLSSTTYTATIPTIILIPETTSTNSQSLQYAQELKNLLGSHNDIRVIMAKPSHNKNTLYQASSLANRLKANLVINFSMSKHDEIKPTLGIYYRSLNKLTESTQNKKQLDLLSIINAHNSCILATKQYAHDLYTSLHTAEQLKMFNLTKPLGIPLKNNRGLIVPGICLDLTTDGKISPKPILKSIAAAIKKRVLPHYNATIQDNL